MYVEERLFKGDGHDSFGHSSTPWENAIILVRPHFYRSFILGLGRGAQELAGGKVEPLGQVWNLFFCCRTGHLQLSKDFL